MSGIRMHGWILYNGCEVRELTRSCEEALAAGVQLEVVAPKDVDLQPDGGDQASIFVRGRAVPSPMFVIAAFVEEDDACNLALLQQLETQGVLCVNRSETLKRTSELNVPAEILQSIGRQLKERAMESSKAAAEGIRSLDELREKGVPELVRLFLGACHSVEKIQHNVLMDIVRRNAETEFGREHGFVDIHSVEDFRRKVPVCEWADLEPYAKRMENCEKDLLFAGLPQHFVCTSGTTGSMKFIPESSAGDLAKSVVSQVRLALLAKMAPEIMVGFFLPLANAAAMGTTVGGIPYGSASGLTLAATSAELLRRMAFPHQIRQATDPAAVDYLIMRFAVAKSEVRLVIGNNPGRLTILAEVAHDRREALINDIEQGTISVELKLEAELRLHLEKLLSPDPERAQDLRQMVAHRGRLEPRDYWPNLKIFSCWLGGTIGRYIEGLKSWLPEGVDYIDCGFGASEGKFNIPMKIGVREGPLAIQGCFFEFMPLSGGEPLLAHQLVDGEDYIVLLTSYSGLYRYNLHDIIKVSGFTGQNPNIRFISKTRDIANLAGEKLAGAFLSDLICETLAERNIPWKHFCVVADSAMRRYDFCIEPAEVAHPDAAWLADFEARLMENAIVYKVFRNQRLLHPPRLIVMKSGWLNLLYADRTGPGVTAGQVKLATICDTLPHSEMIAQVVER